MWLATSYVVTNHQSLFEAFVFPVRLGSVSPRRTGSASPGTRCRRGTRIRWAVTRSFAPSLRSIESPPSKTPLRSAAIHRCDWQREQTRPSTSLPKVGSRCCSQCKPAHRATHSSTGPPPTHCGSTPPAHNRPTEAAARQTAPFHSFPRALPQSLPHTARKGAQWQTNVRATGGKMIDAVPVRDIEVWHELR